MPKLGRGMLMLLGHPENTVMPRGNTFPKCWAVVQSNINCKSWEFRVQDSRMHSWTAIVMECDRIQSKYIVNERHFSSLIRVVLVGDAASLRHHSRLTRCGV